MKKVLLIALLLSAQITLAQQAQYDVNFKNITMKEFITFVASFTETNIIYNEADLRGTVSIASQYPMNAAAIMEIFYATLNSNNLVALQEDGYIRVAADKDMVAYEDKFTEEQRIAEEQFVTTIMTLQNYNVTALANTLTRVKSKHGQVEVLRGINGVLIRDFGSRIDKMRTISLQMDNYASLYNLYSITIENATASKIEQQIMKLFNELVKNSITGQLPIVLSDDTSNILVIAATEGDYKKIQYLIEQMDVKTVAESSLPRIFYLRYATAGDLEAVLNKIFTGVSSTSTAPGTPSAPPATRGMGNTRASVSSDNATNSIIALGDAEFYSNLEQMINKLDIPRKQVYVEALIMDILVTDGADIGVDWFAGGASGNTFGYGGVNLDPISTIGGLAGLASGNFTGVPGGYTAGVIGNTITYNGVTFPTIGAFLSAVKTDSGANIVSNPQILTLDNEEAEVFVGQEVSFQTSQRTSDVNESALYTNYERREVGVRLRVVPHIIGDDIVQLEIEQEVNQLGEEIPPGSGQVSTLNRTTSTKVQLYDGAIMVIGGQMSESSRPSVSGIPILRSIPILGWLFKSESNNIEKSNLTLFITARIINTRDDMDAIVERRSDSLSKIKGSANKLIRDELDIKDSFIPMQQEVDNYLYGIGEEEAE